MDPLTLFSETWPLSKEQGQQRGRCLDPPGFVQGRFGVDEAKDADGDTHVLLLHGQLIAQGPKKAFQGKLGGRVGGRERGGDPPCNKILAFCFMGSYRDFISY